MSPEQMAAIEAQVQRLVKEAVEKALDATGVIGEVMFAASRIEAIEVAFRKAVEANELDLRVLALEFIAQCDKSDAEDEPAEEAQNDLDLGSNERPHR